jgi:hypothetical protein
MSEAAIDLDTLPDLDFARYAPERTFAVRDERPRARRELVCVQPQLPQAPTQPDQPPGELEIIGQHMAGAFGLIRQCIQLALIIIWRRAVLRLTTLYHRTAQSLTIAWALAGIGWGGFIAFPVIIHFVR